MPLQGVFNLLTFSPGRCPGLGNDMPFQGGQLTPRLNIRTDNGCIFVGGGDNMHIVSTIEHRPPKTGDQIPYQFLSQKNLNVFYCQFNRVECILLLNLTWLMDLHDRWFSIKRQCRTKGI